MTRARRLRRRSWLVLPLLLPAAGLAADWHLGLELSGATTTFDDTPDRGQFGTGAIIDGRVDGAFDFDDRRDTSASVGVSLNVLRSNWIIGGQLLWHFPVDWDVSAPTPSIQTVTNTFTNVERATLLLRIGRFGQLRDRWQWQVALLAGASYQRLTTDYVERAVPGVRPEQFRTVENNGLEAAWGLELGTKRQLTERWQFGFFYRGLDTGALSVRATADQPATLDSSLFDHQLLLQLSYRLGGTSNAIR